MNVRKLISSLSRVILEEASRNPAFERDLIAAVDDLWTKKAVKVAKESYVSQPKSQRSNKRSPAVIDPVQEVKEGERHLRNLLETLELEKLRDILAEYGMDTQKLAMKWKEKDKVINRIVDVSLSRASKGSAFREGGE